MLTLVQVQHKTAVVNVSHPQTLLLSVSILRHSDLVSKLVGHF